MDLPSNLWIGIVILAAASVASAEFTIAKFFSSFMVLQESPSSANIFGTYDEGPVLLSIDCDSGLSYQYEAELVRKSLHDIGVICFENNNNYDFRSMKLSNGWSSWIQYHLENLAKLKLSMY